MDNKNNKDFIDISKIKDPKFLKSLSYKELDELCSALRKELLTEVSEYGGHLSSNLGIVETTVALHKVFDFEKDKLILDVGHQSYIHKMLTGRSLKHIGEDGYVSGFQKIDESKYDVYEAGHSSTSISAATGFAMARDNAGDNYNVVAVIGDASIVNGLSFEALNDLGDGKHKVIIILNDNDMAITQPQGGLSNYFRNISSSSLYNRMKKKYQEGLQPTKLGRKIYSASVDVKSFIRRCLVRDNTLFEKLGLTYIGPIDGHNIKSLEKAFERSKNTTKSVIVHVRTVKGKGYKYSEQDKTGYWHGVSPFNLDTGKPKDLHEGYITWSSYFAQLTCKMMEEHENAYLIVPATLKGSGLENCFATFPKRCIDVGIAEEHALTLSSALALNNIHPIVTIYSTFLQRAYDELSHDCARLKSNMTLIIDRAGLVGKDGDTHQGIYDVAYLRTIPNVTITMPTNKEEASQLYIDSFDNYGIFAIRYEKDYVVDNSDNQKISLPYGSFRWEKEEPDNKVCIVGVGPNSRTLLNQINDKKIDVSYTHAIYLNPISKNEIEKLSKFENIIIYDSYGTKEGFAEGLTYKLIEAGYKGNIISKCIPTAFIKQGKVKDQYKEFGLDFDSIISLCKSLIK